MAKKNPPMGGGKGNFNQKPKTSVNQLKNYYSISKPILGK